MNEFLTPILLIVFNRPHQTRIVFERIKEIKPRNLFIAADGPRPTAKEVDNCIKVRQLFTEVDWDCRVHKLFREENLGCKKSVSAAIDWFFENVDEGIILEDDCLPELSFFRFCKELLDFYRDDNRIMMISGGNYQFGRNITEESYYFSRYTHVWGWATWKNRWKLYDINMEKWPGIEKNKFFNDILDQKEEARYWENIFNRVYKNRIDTWDYQLLFSSWVNHRLSIVPNVNMISNIGFDGSATHTNSPSPLSNMSVSSMNFPLQHPKIVKRNVDADNYTSQTHYRNFYYKKLKTYILSKLKSLYPI